MITGPPELVVGRVTVGTATVDGFKIGHSKGWVGCLTERQMVDKDLRQRRAQSLTQPATEMAGTVAGQTATRPGIPEGVPPLAGPLPPAPDEPAAPKVP